MVLTGKCTIWSAWVDWCSAEATTDGSPFPPSATSKVIMIPASWLWQ
jgi:hypothetical protein